MRRQKGKHERTSSKIMLSTRIASLHTRCVRANMGIFRLSTYQRVKLYKNELFTCLWKFAQLTLS